ncbi:hypothetical protein [Ottowia sp.]|uniref:hypothetical protein n=1 Tax=Ottowia sp. TaxID=1898956 RepID=UPI0025CC1FCB|nr:hypothetical protein [Ottowia sp.]MBK6616428.1 hypothetical protein [Ottowia sp.]
MSIESELRQYLADNMLSPEDVGAVIAKVKVLPGVQGTRWADPENGYPMQLRAILKACARSCALAYLAENAPDHVAVLMFGPADVCAEERSTNGGVTVPPVGA